MMTQHLWTEWHLVPCGWVTGSQKTELGSIFEVEAPHERVMTCRYEELETEEGKGTLEVLWKSPDDERLKTLVEAFGECPRRV